MRCVASMRASAGRARASGPTAGRRAAARRMTARAGGDVERSGLAITPTAKNYVALNGVTLVVDFEVPYDTAFGENLCMVGSHENLGAWELERAKAMTWTEGNVWKASVELPAGGVFFYKYVVKGPKGDIIRWQEGSNSMLVLPESWNVPSGSHYLVEDNFAGLPNGTTEISESLLASKLVSAQGEKTELLRQLEVQRNMTQTALEELLLAREELAKTQTKLLGSNNGAAR